MKIKALCSCLTLLHLGICAPILAQSNGFSLAVGTNVAYLCSKQDLGAPGAYLSATLAKSKFQLALAVSAYRLDKQYGVHDVVGDLDNAYFLNTIQGRLSLGYNILAQDKISLAPVVGFALDRRDINSVETYTTEPGSQKLLTTSFRQQTQHSTGVLVGVQGRLALSRRLSLDFWSHFQRFQEKKPSNLEEALFKGNVWLTGLGLAYHW